VSQFVREGYWIPLLFFLAAVICLVWMVYRKLDQIRHRDGRFEGGLSEVLLHYRVAVERIHRADSWVEAGELDRAITELEEVKRVHTSVSATDYVLGKAYLKKGETSLAREHLEAFLANTRPYDQLSSARLEEARGLLKGLS
jgi:hypothetical protein